MVKRKNQKDSLAHQILMSFLFPTKTQSLLDGPIKERKIMAALPCLKPEGIIQLSQFSGKLLVFSDIRIGFATHTVDA